MIGSVVLEGPKRSGKVSRPGIGSLLAQLHRPDIYLISCCFSYRASAALGASKVVP